MPRPERRHGTRSKYTSKCRCDACTRAATREQNMRRMRMETGPLKVPALGAQRRIHALRASGWPLATVADELGVTMGSISTLIYKERTTITRTMHDRVAAVFDRLASRPGPSSLTRDKALKQGYAPAMAWDDDTIDDPDAVPVGVRQGRGAGEYEFDVDEWFWLVRTVGETPERAAERCGVRLPSVYYRCLRNGRSDEYSNTLHQARERTAA